MNSLHAGNLPNFLYIGVARAGSTWLYQILREHPEVFVPAAKDIYFFDRFYEKGLEWYGRFFNDAGLAKAVGELSHDYYESAEAADRIAAALPDVKLICCLREPAEYLVSTYLYARTAAIGPEVSLTEFSAQDEMWHRVDYYGNLKVYFERFPREQVLIVFYDDLRDDPAAFARSIFTFLGVDPDFAAPSTYERINPSRKARNERLARFVYWSSQLMRRAGMPNLVGRVKHNPVLYRLLYSPQKNSATAPIEPLPSAMRQALRSNHGKLEELLGRPLPEGWYV